MGRIRRSPLAAVLLTALLPLSCFGVNLELSSEPGSLTVVNPGPTALELDPGVAVERWDQDHWTPVSTSLKLVSDCAQLQQPVKCVRLAPGANLHVVSWKGFSCSGQCAGSCRANIYYGPGKFRFIVRTCDGSQKYVSKTFTLPANPPPAF